MPATFPAITSRIVPGRKNPKMSPYANRKSVAAHSAAIFNLTSSLRSSSIPRILRAVGSRRAARECDRVIEAHLQTLVPPHASDILGQLPARVGHRIALQHPTESRRWSTAKLLSQCLRRTCQPQRLLGMPLPV